jgi:diguanylate cyclase (GGDEF)-like protein
MRYQDDAGKSVECLRLALKMMEQHGIAPHPVCYAVWYEYAGNINPSLNAAIDKLRVNGREIGDDTMHALYREHIACGGDAGMLMRHLEKSRREVEMLREEILRAREDALADGLTGLLNRRGFDLAMQSCLALGGGHPEPSLLIADIDHFKRINDNHGHIFGDRVIRGVASVLRDNVKGRDVAARYGGEEFIVLLPDTLPDGACILAEKIRGAVALCRFRRVDDREACEHVTISIGIAHHRNGETPVDFIERADAALYTSKANGRNRVTVAEAVATD